MGIRLKRLIPRAIGAKTNKTLVMIVEAAESDNHLSVQVLASVEDAADDFKRS